MCVFTIADFIIAISKRDIDFSAIRHKSSRLALNRHMGLWRGRPMKIIIIIVVQIEFLNIVVRLL